MKTHPVSVTHLVVGVVYVCLALAWALGELGVIGVGSLEWVLPATLIAAGAAGVLASMAKAVRRRSHPEDTEGGPAPAWSPTWETPAEPGWGPVSAGAPVETAQPVTETSSYPWAAPDPAPAARTFVAGPRVGSEAAAGARPGAFGDTGVDGDTGSDAVDGADGAVDSAESAAGADGAVDSAESAAGADNADGRGPATT